MSRLTPMQYTILADRLEYAFQPIVNIHTGAIYAFEGLLRRVDEAGFPSIPHFFDQMYNDHQLDRMHQLLFEQAYAKIRQLSFFDEIKFFYNIDSRLFESHEIQPHQFIGGDLISDLARGKICLEITEHNNLVCSNLLKEKIRRIRTTGCSLAVDDFGTGFSGTHLLYYVEPEYVKLDRFYIDGIENDTTKRMLAASMVKMAHLMGSRVIAEGVETKAEYFCCKSIGCDLLQGYFVQKPTLAVEDLQRNYQKIYDLTLHDKRKETGKGASLINAEIKYIEPIHYDTKLVAILDMFKNNRQCTYFPVINQNNEALGIIREEAIKEFSYQEYGRYLMMNPTFKKKIDHFITKIPIVDIHTPIEEIIEAFSAHDYLEGIVITNNMKYIGFLMAQSLVRIINEIKLAEAADRNPLSQLPGNKMIYEYLSLALKDTKKHYCIVYFDFDHFKVYNDKYGFRQGDRAILLFSELLKSKTQTGERFAGHVGGDDFFMGIKEEPLSSVVKEVAKIAKKFKTSVESFYDPKAIADGCITGKDRDGTVRTFPLMSVSAAVLSLPIVNDRLQTPEDIGNIMAGLKKGAKQAPDKICVAKLNLFNSVDPTADDGSSPHVKIVETQGVLNTN